MVSFLFILIRSELFVWFQWSLIYKIKYTSTLYIMKATQTIHTHAHTHTKKHAVGTTRTHIHMQDAQHTVCLSVYRSVRLSVCQSECSSVIQRHTIITHNDIHNTSILPVLPTLARVPAAMTRSQLVVTYNDPLLSPSLRHQYAQVKGNIGRK